MPPIPVSATLAANEILIRRRQAGEPVLPLSFGEAGLPVHPRLRAALAGAAGRNSYGPVAGLPGLREAAAGYWTRRSLPTGPESVISGPGSKPLLFGLMLAIGADVAVPQPSWVSYAAQAALAGARPHFVPTPAGEGGLCDPASLVRAAEAARAAGRRIGAVLVTVPDNPTGRFGDPATVEDLAGVAARYDLVIISDEIYRDLVFDSAAAVASPVELRPGAHRGHHRAQQEPGPRRLADRGGQAPGRPARPGFARPAARHRQRDLVLRLRPRPGGGRAGVR